MGRGRSTDYDIKVVHQLTEKLMPALFPNDAQKNVMLEVEEAEFCTLSSLLGLSVLMSVRVLERTRPRMTRRRGRNSWVTREPQNLMVL